MSARLTDIELADVAARIDDPRCHVCRGTGDRTVDGIRNASRECETCSGTGNLALSTATMQSLVAELHALRLLAEDVEALRWVAGQLSMPLAPAGRDDKRISALALLARLTGGGE